MYSFRRTANGLNTNGPTYGVVEVLHNPLRPMVNKETGTTTSCYILFVYFRLVAEIPVLASSRSIRPPCRLSMLQMSDSFSAAICTQVQLLKQTFSNQEYSTILEKYFWRLNMCNFDNEIITLLS
jgi:hypothetical protein